MLDAKFFFKIGPEVVAKFRKHTFMDALDIKGNKFPNYNKSPASIKYGEAKRSGKLFRQATEFANSTAPVLTTDLLRDWTMRKTSASGFTFGTLAHGGKVNHLAKLGRVISTEAKPIPGHIEKYIIKEANKYAKKQWKKEAEKDQTWNM
tara:strand:+ start:293 stop:739 length:447 start_codon:yes stop_codon:yes gene_type:complete